MAVGTPGGDRPADTGGWAWALGLVASLHLLIVAGTWYVVDHGELLHVARRVITRGTLDLRRVDDPRGTVAVLDFPPAAPGRPSRTRLLPLPALTAVPLLALDEALGWGDARNFGTLVHLQGEIFVLAALGLVGWSVRRSGGSPRAAALAVAISGLAWPTCLVARRVGPEPVLVFLVALFTAAAIARRAGSRAGGALQFLACALLPWTHATGPLIAGALVLAAGLERLLRPGAGRDWRGAVRATAPALAGAALGVLSMSVLWNGVYQGNWWAGGYSRLMTTGSMALRNPLLGLWLYGRDFAVQTAVLLGCAIAAVRRVGARSGSEGLAVALSVTGTLLFFFALFAPSDLFPHEPARRLAASVPAWGVVAGAGWDRVSWRRPAPQLLLALSLPVPIYELGTREQTYFLLPSGVSSSWPQILWVRRLVTGAPWWTTALPVALLIVTGCWCLLRTGRLLSAVPPSEQDRDRARAQ